MNTKLNEHYNDLCINDCVKYCETVLPHVSRTFALGILALRGDLKKATTAGYLLCRIADTIEDDLNIDPELKCHYLNIFLQSFDDKEKVTQIIDCAKILSGDPHHISLVENTHKVFFLYESLTQNTKVILRKWITEMTLGMKKFTKNYPKGIRIKSLGEFKEYCYFVAGTVGFLLTDLWKEHGFFITKGTYKKLLRKAVFFGEGLQSINILKDIPWDMKKENAYYIPEEELNRLGLTQDHILEPNKKVFVHKVLDKMISISKKNLFDGLDYVINIPKINFRIRFFCILPLLLACATLREIKNAKDLINPESPIKISKKEVLAIYRKSIFSSISNRYFMKCAQSCLKECVA